jgi:hypothetical protein
VATTVEEAVTATAAAPWRGAEAASTMPAAAVVVAVETSAAASRTVVEAAAPRTAGVAVVELVVACRSQRDVAVLAAREFLALGGQHAQPGDQLLTGLGRVDHVVDVAPLGGPVR